MTALAELLQTLPYLFVILCGIAGLLVGSFLNVVIHRLPKMLEREWLAQCAGLQGNEPANSPPYNLFIPHSACPHCNQKISAPENIPVISYLYLRGKCKHCSMLISPRYPIVETLCGLLSAYSAWHFGFGSTTLAALIFIWLLLVLAFIDLDTQMLPDDITLPLLWLGLLFNLSTMFTNIGNAVIGAIAGYLSLWTIYWLFRLLTRKEGMGYGDFKLLAAIGAWLGWQMLPLVILFAAMTGTMVGILLIITARHSRNTPIPFGPYLAGGGLIALFWGKTLTQSYLQLLVAP